MVPIEPLHSDDAFVMDLVYQSWYGICNESPRVVEAKLMDLPVTRTSC